MAITFDSQQAGRAGRTPAAGRVVQRARAFTSAQRHSRLVRVLRVLCPLAAGTVLAVYGLLVALNWQMTAGRFKVGGIEITADDLTMKDPSYFDVTKDGRYEVRAKRAIVTFGQDKKQPIKLVDVSGEMVQKSGTVTKLKAKHGLYDNAKGELELFDGIEIDGSNGMMARLSRAMIYSKEGRVVTSEPVSATTPTGSVQAAAMTMNSKTRLVQFRGDVVVRLVPQAGQGIGAGLGTGIRTGKEARQPVDVRCEELDVDDAAKVAHFRGKVVAVQGDTMLQAPYLMVKYEGKAAAALEQTADAAAGAGTAADKAKEGGARVTFLWARNGVEVTAGNDRRITSDLADFDVASESALFSGNVVATQEKNVLKGGRLSVDRKSGKTRLDTPATGSGPAGRIAATFYQNGPAQPRPSKRQATAEAVAGITGMGGFKVDRSAPMNVESNTLELIDSANKAVFSGNVAARQGDMLLRTSELTAFYSGKSGLAAPSPGEDAAGAKAKEKGEIVRLEARNSVIITSKDQSATAKWADFDVKGNTALLGGGVVVDKLAEGADDPLKRNIVSGDRLRINLTTGTYQFESDPGVAAPAPPDPAKAPVSSLGVPTACPPGRQCGVIFRPQQVKEKALEVIKRKAPAVAVP